MFIVQLEHAIHYPVYINRKTSTASCMRWKQNHLYCCYENEPYTLLLSCTRFKQGERVFLLSLSCCCISRRQAHVRGVTRSKAVISSWIMNVVFGRCFPFDIIGEIPAWPRKNGSYGKKLLSTRIQNWTRKFWALFVKLNVDNQYMPNTSFFKALILKKPYSRSA